MAVSAAIALGAAGNRTIAALQAKIARLVVDGRSLTVPAHPGGLFLGALKGETDPERKRRIIGGLFVEVFEEVAAKLEGIRWLAQGTIYPDVIESAGAKTGKAHVIKSHHNVAGLPENMNLKLVEPLRELFKDEVRRIGVELGLPREMVYRHPFPGPGLAVRILGEVTRQFAGLLRRADAMSGASRPRPSSGNEPASFRVYRDRSRHLVKSLLCIKTSVGIYRHLARGCHSI